MFTFQRDELQIFDIILVRFPDDDQSLGIREYCNSEFSHAIIYLGNGSFIEGVEPVVSLFSHHRYFFPDLDNVRVLRLSQELKNDFDHNSAEQFIRGLSSCNYSKRLLIFLRNKNIDERIINAFHENQRWLGGIVCTSLVTLTYYIGGIDLSNNDQPYYADFNEIENYNGFVDVTNDVFEAVEEGQIRPDAHNYLTAFETDSLLERQSEIVSRFNTYVENKFNEIKRNPENFEDIVVVEQNLQFGSWEDMFPNLMRWFLTETGKEIDNDLSEMIIDSGYNILWFDEIHRHPQQYFPIYYINYRMHSIPVIEDLEFLRNMLISTHERIAQNERVSFENFSMCPCKTFHVLLDMYRSFSDLLQSSIQQYNVLINGYDQLLEPHLE